MRRFSYPERKVTAGIDNMIGPICALIEGVAEFQNHFAGTGATFPVSGSPMHSAHILYINALIIAKANSANWEPRKYCVTFNKYP